MWLMTTRGFFSVVAKPWDEPAGTLTVRGRALEDMVGLAQLFAAPGPITTDPDADYGHRFQAPRLEVSQVFATLILGIGYDNFKTEVKKRQGPERARLYSQVWGTLLALDDRPRRAPVGDDGAWDDGEDEFLYPGEPRGWGEEGHDLPAGL